SGTYISSSQKLPLTRLLRRDLENVQAVVKHCFLRIAQHPVVSIEIMEHLPRHLRGAHHDGCACDSLVLRQLLHPQTISSRIHTAEISEVNLFLWVHVLVTAQGQQTLSPVQVAVAQQLVTPVRGNERREVREVVGSVAQSVSGIKCYSQHYQGQNQVRAPRQLRPPSGHKQQDEGIHGQDVAVADVNVGKDG